MSQLDMLKGDIDPLTKHIAFLAILTANLEAHGGSPVAGGDYAVELYTEGRYKAASIDLYASAELLDKVLLAWGFEKENGSITHKDIDVAVNLLGEDLGKVQLERVNQVDVNGFPIYLLGVEDIIVNKFADFVHRNDSSALTWAQEMIELHVQQLDLDYLEERAEQEGTLDALMKLLIELRIEDEEPYEDEE